MFKIFYDDAQCIPDLGDICDLPLLLCGVQGGGGETMDKI